MKKKIAILGANYPSLHFYIQAKKLGYEIHSIAWPEGAICQEYSDFFYPVSFTEKEQVLDICRKIGIQGITSFSLESALPVVNYIAQKLNLTGNPPECELLTENKYTMRKQLKICGISIPEFHTVKSENELLGIELDFPVIVKPVDSGGSRGVTKIIEKKELSPAIKRALGFSRKKQVLIEQYIEGREFSVEYISYKGEHYYLAITDKITTGPPYFVELEHHQPAFISEELAFKIKAITEKTLDALRIYSSASHTEIKMNNKGELFIIEVGPRMGGDFITSDLVRLSTGYDFVKGILELSSGNFTPPLFGTKMHSGVYFLTNQTKHIKQYIDFHKNYPEIVDSALYGNPVVEVRESNDRAGHFIYQLKNSRFKVDI